MKQFEDRLGKYIIGTLFGDYTHVEIGTDLLPNTFYADILLIPDKPLPDDIPGVGFLTRLTQDARCLIEPFSGSLQTVRLEGTISKLRLALQRAHDDHIGISPARGVLWLIVPYWPKTAIKQVFVVDGEEVEQGVLKWRGFERETVYMVNTSLIPLRDDTLLFHLLAKGNQRKEAVTKVFFEQLEPFITLLNNFDLRFKEMARSYPKDVTIEELIDMIDFHDTREEVLRELGRKEGLEKGLERGLEKGLERGLERGLEKGLEKGLKKGLKKGKKKIAQRMLENNLSLEQIALFTELSIDEIKELK